MAIDQVQLVGGGRGALCVLAMGTLAPGPSCPTPAHLPVSPIGYGPPSGLGAGEAWEMGFGSGGGSHLRNTRGPPCCCSPRNPPAALPAVSSLSFPPSHHLPHPPRSPSGVYQGHSGVRSPSTHLRVQLFPSLLVPWLPAEASSRACTPGSWGGSEQRKGGRGLGSQELPPPAPPRLPPSLEGTLELSHQARNG